MQEHRADDDATHENLLVVAGYAGEVHHIGKFENEVIDQDMLVDLKIDDSLLEDKDSLQILLISCMNDIIKQSEENKKRMAMNLMGNLGGLGNLGQK